MPVQQRASTATYWYLEVLHRCAQYALCSLVSPQLFWRIRNFLTGFGTRTTLADLPQKNRISNTVAKICSHGGIVAVKISLIKTAYQIQLFSTIPPQFLPNPILYQYECVLMRILQNYRSPEGSMLSFVYIKKRELGEARLASLPIRLATTVRNFLWFPFTSGKSTAGEQRERGERLFYFPVFLQ